MIFVAMATRRRNLQTILFLNHEAHGFLFMNDKIDLKTPKIVELCIFLRLADICCHGNKAYEFCSNLISKHPK